MTLALIRLRPAVLLLAITVVAALPGVAAAQRETAGRAAAPAERQGRAVPAQPSAVTLDIQNANETRDKLQDILRKYPPTVGQVLKLDPSLLDKPDYLASYPALQGFLTEHPEVVHNPDFFFSNVWMYATQPRAPRSQGYETLSNVLGGLAALAGAAIVAGTLLWLIKTILDYRRWNRLSKIQTEVHNKILDRFTANDDLLAYIQTSPGRKFLESAPIPLQEEARSIGAPMSRILWSVQAGVVLALLGIGLLFVSGRVVDEVAQGLFVMGVLVLTLGLGFVVSAMVAYLISRRLGLFERRAEEHA